MTDSTTTPAVTIRELDRDDYRIFWVNAPRWGRVKIMVWQLHISTSPITGGHANTGIELVIWGDSPAMSHFWPACGTQPWWDWLEDTGQDYFLNKMTSSQHREFDGEGTLREAKRDILRWRREGNLSQEEARDAWTDIEHTDRAGSKDHVIDRLGDIPCFRDDYWERAQHRLKPVLDRFWAEVWRPFIQAMKDRGGRV